MQALESPLKIAVVGTPAAHYLGLPAGWSVVLGAAFLVVWELGMLAFGFFDYRFGIVRQQTQVNNEQDPWKQEVVRLLAALRPREVPPPPGL